MKSQFTSAVFAFGLIFFAFAPAKADTVNVSAGRTSQVLAFSLFNLSNCNYGPKPKVTLKQPEHGTLTASWVTGKSNDKGKCFGKLMKGYLIRYRPKGGFHGADKGAVNFFYPTYVNGSSDKSHYIKLDINVK